MISEGGPIERGFYWLMDKLKYINIEYWIIRWATRESKSSR